MNNRIKKVFITRFVCHEMDGFTVITVKSPKQTYRYEVSYNASVEDVLDAVNALVNEVEEE